MVYGISAVTLQYAIGNLKEPHLLAGKGDIELTWKKDRPLILISRQLPTVLHIESVKLSY